MLQLSNNEMGKGAVHPLNEKEQHAAYMRSWRLRNLNEERLRDRRRYWNARREKQLARMLRRHREIKRDVFSHYASIGRIECVCCKEHQLLVLTLHHPNGDGGVHRLAIFGKKRVRSFDFYLWLKNHNYPQQPKLEILCENCHHAITQTGSCPHKN